MSTGIDLTSTCVVQYRAVALTGYVTAPDPADPSTSPDVPGDDRSLGGLEQQPRGAGEQRIDRRRPVTERTSRGERERAGLALAVPGRE